MSDSLLDKPTMGGTSGDYGSFGNDSQKQPLVASYQNSNHEEELTRSYDMVDESSLHIRQVMALVRKNLHIFRNQKIRTTLIILLPLITLAILMIVNSSVSSSSGGSLYVKRSFSIPKCSYQDAYGIKRDAKGKCLTMLYSPNDDFHRSVMANFLKQQPHLSEEDVVGVGSSDELFEVLGGAGLGAVENAVYFNRTLVHPKFSQGNAESWSDFPDTMNNVFYRVLYNKTYDDATGGLVGRQLAIQSAIDSAIVATLTGVDSDEPLLNPSFERIKSFYPSSADDDDFNYRDELPKGHPDAVLFGGGVSVVFAVATVCVLIFIGIGREKHLKQIGMMDLMGLRKSSLWLSYLLSYTPIVLLSTLLYLFLGYAVSGFAIFTRTSFFVHFLATFSFSMCMVGLAMFFGSFTSQPKWVNLFVFLIHAFAVLVTGILIDQSFVYSPSIPPVLRALFYSMPWHHFSKIYTDILFGTGTSEDEQTKRIIYHHYSFSDIYNDRKESNCDSDCFTIPSTNFSILMLWGLLCVYSLLAWYCSQVFTEGGKRFYFLFQPSYWGFGEKKVLHDGDTIAAEKQLSEQNQSVRIHKLSKAFKDVSAVKELSLQMNLGEVFVILGHNGAGKSTTINMLTGMVGPTFGEAFIFGKSIREDMEEIQEVMGNCPQHDILWNDLTAYEHLMLYGRMRGIPTHLLPALIEKKLKEFYLGEMIYRTTGEMSGGMKRRLSMSIATIGNPRIVFLDEPTTGMDPLNKHNVWKAIRNLKKDRIVVLTTHSMEEAGRCWLSLCLVFVCFR